MTHITNIFEHRMPHTEESCMCWRLSCSAGRADEVGGLMAVEMVKYAASDDGKNGQF